MNHKKPLGVWFPTIQAGTGVDVFTSRLVDALVRAGHRAEIAWLPHRAEFAPWTVQAPKAPEWADVIHVNSWLHPRFYANLGRPAVVTCHGCVHDPALGPYKSQLQSAYHKLWVHQLEARAFSAASVITAVSAYTSGQMKNAFGNLEVHVIPNWLPSDAFSFNEREQPQEPFRLLYVGKWSRRKGADLLAEIMELLGADFELHFTGIPPNGQVLPSNMIPLGWATSPATIRDWMYSADALIFPSRMEGMPLAVLEALACGLPVICTEAASLPEIVANSENGLICPVDDVEAFVRAARSLRGDEAMWMRVRFCAHSHAKSVHSEGRALESFRNIYNLAARRGIAIDAS
jgi:glycosyltransferase involved in cell wall biosynthesis